MFYDEQNTLFALGDIFLTYPLRELPHCLKTPVSFSSVEGDMATGLMSQSLHLARWGGERERPSTRQVRRPNGNISPYISRFNKQDNTISCPTLKAACTPRLYPSLSVSLGDCDQEEAVYQPRKNIQWSRPCLKTWMSQGRLFLCLLYTAHTAH